MWEITWCSPTSMKPANSYSELVPSVSHQMYHNVIFPCSVTSIWPLKKNLPTKILCAALVCHRLIVLTILQYLHSPWSSSLHDMLNYPVASAFIGSNIFLGTWCSDTCTVCCTFKIRNHVSQPHKMRGSDHRLLPWAGRMSYLPKCKMNSPPLQYSVFRTIPKFALARFCMSLMHA